MNVALLYIEIAVPLRGMRSPFASLLSSSLAVMSAVRYVFRSFTESPWIATSTVLLLFGSASAVAASKSPQHGWEKEIKQRWSLTKSDTQHNTQQERKTRDRQRGGRKRGGGRTHTADASAAPLLCARSARSFARVLLCSFLSFVSLGSFVVILAWASFPAPIPLAALALRLVALRRRMRSRRKRRTSRARRSTWRCGRRRQERSTKGYNAHSS